MKKLLPILFLIMFNGGVFAQGNNPFTPPSGALPNYTIGVNYPITTITMSAIPSMVTINTADVPALQQFISFLPPTLDVTVTSVTYNVTGLLSGLTATCNPSGCTYAAGASGSIDISGNTSDAVGTDTLMIKSLTTGSTVVTIPVIGDLPINFPGTVQGQAVPELSDIFDGGPYSLHPDEQAPTANFTSSSSNICTGTTVNFTNQSTNATSYSWSFSGGNPNSSNQPNPSVVYNSSGTYTATLTAYNGGNTDVHSITITVSSNPNASISYSGSTSICSGQSLTLSGNTGSGYSYQWQNNGVNISGATNSTFSAGSNGNYTVVITNSCGSAVSQSVTVTVSNSQTAIVTPSGSISFCQGQSAVLSANTGNGFSYQWQNNGVNISGATSSTYTASLAGNYSVVITSSCGTATSQSVAVSVNQSQSATISVNGSTDVCTGQSVLLTANSGTNGLTYQWHQNGVDISGATNSTYYATSSGNYTVTVTSSCGTATSQAVSVSVSQAPTATISANGSTSFCQGQSVVLSSNTGNGYSYQWQNNGVNISGATNSTYTATAAGNYTVTITNSCSSAVSQAITVTISNSQTASVSPNGSISFCQGQSAVLSANTGNGYSYQWQNNGTNINGATGSTYTATVAGNYSVTISSSCGTATSQSVSVSVTQSQTATVTASGPTTFCQGQSIELTANSGTSGLTYQWQLNNVNLSGATNSTYTVTSAGSYTVVVTSSCGTAVSQPVSITVNQLPTVTINPGGSTSFCDGGSVQLVANTNGVISYQWQLNGVNISGATSSVYTATQSGNFTVIVVNGSGCTSSAVQTVEVQSSDINPSFTSNQQLFTAPPFAVQFTNTTPNLSNYNFTWYFGDGSSLNSNNTIVFHEYDYNGLYDVILYAADQNVNCEDSIVFNDYIYCTGGTDNPNGINEININLIIISPNPATTEITINGYSPAYLKLCSMLGQTVAEANKTNKLYIGNLSQGLYVLQLFDEKGSLVKTEKVVKK